MFLDWLRSWTRPPRVEEGLRVMAERLRGSYIEHLNEEPLTLEQRVAHHLYHLSLYWSRWIGFMDLDLSGPPDREADVPAGLGVMVQVGTELSDADVREYCACEGASDLADAWNLYQAALADVQVRHTVVASAVHHANDCFARVDEIRRARGLLHPFEVQRMAQRGDSGMSNEAP